MHEITHPRRIKSPDDATFLEKKSICPTGHDDERAVSEKDTTWGDGGGSASAGMSPPGFGTDPNTGFAGGHDCATVL